MPAPDCAIRVNFLASDWFWLCPPGNRTGSAPAERFPVRLVIVEDQPLFRDFIRLLCGPVFGHEVVGTCGDGGEALPLIRATRPEIALIDLNLPGETGFEVAARITAERLETRCLFMSVDCSELTLWRVERARAHGFVDKNACGVTEFQAALDAVATGRKYYSANYLAVQDRRKADRRSFDKLLTAREQEILSLIGLAMSNEEIAHELGIAVATVETHRHNLLVKLGVAGTPKLIRYAIDHGFTQFPPRSFPRMKSSANPATVRGSRPPLPYHPGEKVRVPA